ncbi:MAG TPA: hypothetical protein VFN35_15455 [Ktedonobacteraceae bacterium]|nr:hypothetical protein [Ktedonobacteraceae bacterium]
MKKRQLLIVGLTLFFSLLASCGTPAQSSNPPQSGATSSPDAAQRPLNDTYLTSINQVADASKGAFHTPLDSTPDANGTIVYFTATGPQGPGIFRVPVAGGTVTQVYAGTPFVAPRGIAASPDGTSLVIADSQAGHGGELFIMPATGGTPAPIKGSQGSAPQNLNIYTENGQQLIYFTGKDAHSSQPAILTLPQQGAQAPGIIYKGAPLVMPDGIVLAPSNTIYVSDQGAASSGDGKIFKIANKNITALLSGIHVGNPAGIALSPDDAILLISAHQATSSSDQVLLLDLNSLQTGSVTKVVGQNANAGGLHASPLHKDVFAWADSPAFPNTGRVFTIK